MKKVISFLAIFIAVFIMGANGSAEIKANTFSFSPLVGGYMFEGKEGLSNKPISGLRIGYDITRHWALEGVFEFLKTEYSDPALTSKTSLYGYRLETLYHFLPERRLVPYLAAGAGGRSIN
ncbi:MAG: porin family protein, partial [Syntrophales bacterium LBB04]|nr:porin family protein [Syntrophales bacterium LBB04]